MEDTHFLAMVSANKSLGENDCFVDDDAATFCLEDQNDNTRNGFKSLTKHSFQSLTSDHSIVKQITKIGVDASNPVELSSHSGSAKRRMLDKEDEDDASSVLKRKRH